MHNTKKFRLVYKVGVLVMSNKNFSPTSYELSSTRRKIDISDRNVLVVIRQGKEDVAILAE